jgi:aminopeptidase N
MIRGLKSIAATALMLCIALGAVSAENIKVEEGVSLELAKYRKSVLSNINYDLYFTVPEDKTAPIPARAKITFTLSNVAEDLQFDFREDANKLNDIVINETYSEWQFQREHILIPASALKVGDNTIEIDFTAGNTSLNRSEGYLYTLFVPDRARTAFPVFDQPNLKSTYDLTLDVPAHWTALSNGPQASEIVSGERRIFSFEKSDAIPSYLFSFVAGEFERVTRTLDGRTMTMLHRETDGDKVARNLDQIFELHRASLAWLEEYTGIQYPFKKFDFALIPAFQYGGMEHVGAIQYRASSLFLDESPSDAQLLNRANLIAHESAHMWFGNLVTMDWFNDVWTKEVYANFMAAKIVNPSFPDVDHELNFLSRSYPAAYSVDRTEGANPIRQHLANLNEAGTLYGAIIYNKAPIMMQQLELLLGKGAFRDGIREYMKSFAGGNATWPDLIAIFDKRSEADIKTWSDVWVNTPGRPTFDFAAQEKALLTIDATGKDRIWPQVFNVAPRSAITGEQWLNVAGAKTALEAIGEDIFLNADGKGYGLFPANVTVFKENWDELSSLQKGSLLIMLYEQLLEGAEDVRPANHLRDLLRLIEREDNQIILSVALGHIQNIYWSFLSAETRSGFAQKVEAVLWTMMAEAKSPAVKKLLYRRYANMALSESSIRRLKALWDGALFVEKLTLSEADKIALAGLLAVKAPAQAKAIVLAQAAMIQNPDRKRRFDFIKPALSADQAVRDAFFDSLKDEQNREVESWVLAALRYLHHPLRTDASEKYLFDSLDLLAEIQRTGDIFFPARWTANTLGNYQSDQAVKTVRKFLRDRPDYNYQLKLKILQSADTLFRANRVLKANGDSD